jgi:ribose 1,5-bisphosphokinase PhnN
MNSHPTRRHFGHALIANEQILHSRTLEPNFEKLINLQSVRRVIVVGSSGVGKSTLERYVRHLKAYGSGALHVPTRHATRPPRSDDASTNLQHLTEQEFRKLCSQHKFGLYGSKYGVNKSLNYFGFEKPSRGTFPVYFANNGVVKNPELVRPATFTEDSLIIAIHAPERLRKKRLKRRSPHYFTPAQKTELAFRLSYEERSSRFANAAHVIVHNYGRNSRYSAIELYRLLEVIAKFTKY